MKIKELTAYLESIAPVQLQEDYDNAGLILGDPEAQLKGAIICLDSTEEVIDEAIKKGCNLVIAHHPLIFRGLKKINGSNYVERAIIKAIRNGIAVYAIHTNLDNVFYRGVNEKIASKIGLVQTRLLLPRGEASSGTISHILAGSGILGELEHPREVSEFLSELKSVMKTKVIRHTFLHNNLIHRVAICGGSGSFLLQEAIEQGADIFITGDVKYHEFFDADQKIIIADIGHYESEQYTMELLFEIISEKFPNFALHLTKVYTNPIRYF